MKLSTALCFMAMVFAGQPAEVDVLAAAAARDVIGNLDTVLPEITISAGNEKVPGESAVLETAPAEADSLEAIVTKTDVAEVAASESISSEIVQGETAGSETAAPETDASETDASETDASETDASETDASETDASETAAPETDAPETAPSETDASETAAPKTVSPEIVAPRTTVVHHAVPQPRTRPPRKCGCRCQFRKCKKGSKNRRGMNRRGMNRRGMNRRGMNRRGMNGCSKVVGGCRKHGETKLCARRPELCLKRVKSTGGKQRCGRGLFKCVPKANRMIGRKTKSEEAADEEVPEQATTRTAVPTNQWKCGCWCQFRKCMRGKMPRGKDAQACVKQVRGCVKETMRN